MPQPTIHRTRVFISYSHHDRRHLERLLTHLAPLQREGKVDVWVDTMLQAGDDWREEIRQALASAKVAIVLVSAEFRASKFIAEQELPPLLSAAKQEGVVIIPVVVGMCDFQESELAHVQAVNDPSRPLNALSSYKRDEVWVSVVRRVRQALGDDDGRAPEGAAMGAPMSSPRASNAPLSQLELQDRAAAIVFQVLDDLPERLVWPSPNTSNVQVFIGGSGSLPAVLFVTMSTDVTTRPPHPYRMQKLIEQNVYAMIRELVCQLGTELVRSHVNSIRVRLMDTESGRTYAWAVEPAPGSGRCQAISEMTPDQYWSSLPETAAYTGQPMGAGPYG